MPAGPAGLEELARAAMYIHLGLHPLSMLLDRFLGITVPGDLDLAMWALLAWLLGSRESELAKKLGFIVAMVLAVAAVLEAVFLAG